MQQKMQKQKEKSNISLPEKGEKEQILGEKSVGLGEKAVDFRRKASYTWRKSSQFWVILQEKKDPTFQ